MVLYAWKLLFRLTLIFYFLYIQIFVYIHSDFVLDHSGGSAFKSSEENDR